MAQNVLNIVHALLYVACIEGAKAATASCLMLSRSCLVPDPSGLPLDVLVHFVPNDGTLQPVTERDYLLKQLIYLTWNMFSSENYIMLEALQNHKSNHLHNSCIFSCLLIDYSH